MIVQLVVRPRWKRLTHARRLYRLYRTVGIGRWDAWRFTWAMLRHRTAYRRRTR